jgi:Tir chaperone protein (CesT) family
VSTPFETFLVELAHVLQFSTLAPDARGACLIIMKDGNIPLLFEFDEQLVPNTVLLSSPITTIPDSLRASIYEAILLGNSSIEDTLSVKPDEDMLYLHRRFHPQIQASEIEALLQNFLATAKQWQEKVKTIAAQPRREDKTPPQLPSSIQILPYKA